MATTQEHLDRFYLELQAWIDGGCGPNDIFETEESICFQLITWACAHRLDDEVLCAALDDSFEDAGLSRTYPFDKDGDAWAFVDNYYENPARLAWIKARADEAKARQAVAA